MKNTTLKYGLGILLLFCGSAASAQEERDMTSPAALERLKDDNLWTFHSSNAAGTTLEQARHYASVWGAYKRSQGDFSRPQAGTATNDINLGTEGGGMLGGVYLWGSFNYSRDKIMGTYFNASLADPFRRMPYYVADGAESDWVNQYYDLKARVAFPRLWDRVIFGLNVDYRNTLAAKQVDIRTETYYYTFNLRPSAIVTLGGGHNIGLTFEYFNQREDAELTLSNLERPCPYYMMKGLGYYDSAIGGHYVSRFYNGNSVGGELQYNYHGAFDVLLSGGFARRVEDVSSTISENPQMAGSVAENSVKAGALFSMQGGRGNTHSVRLDYLDRSMDGIEYVQYYDTGSESQDYVTSGLVVRSNYGATDMRLNYDYRVNRGAEYNWRAGLTLDYQSTDDIYYLPYPSTTERIANVRGGVYFKKNFVIPGSNTNRLLAGLGVDYNKNTEGKYDYHGPTPTNTTQQEAYDAVVGTFMPWDLMIRSADYVGLRAGCTYSQNLDRETNSAVFVSVDAGLLKASGKELAGKDSRFSIKVAAGFNF